MILYAGIKIAVYAVRGTTWVEGGQTVHGVEVECRDAGGKACLSLYRPPGHMFEVIR